ncbi:MAG: hypothetical protein APF77_06210 [Clostridia bacterium BRH_c25]|nr:MAG: hypothetical protein APF77_06210 [Clostridia bacterium BRH_c25]
MAKKAAIITFWSHVAQQHCQQLESLFGDRLEIMSYSYDVDNINSTINADIFILSLYSIYIAAKKYIPNTSQIVIINPTITMEQYDKILEIPAGEKVMVVNYSSEMTMETVALLNMLGINHLEFIPVYPGVKNIPVLNTAITPGEAKYVPDFVENVIDIGNRVMDTSTIVEIALKLKLDFLLQEKKFVDYFNSLKTHRSGLEALLGRANTLESELDSLLNALDDGVVGIDANGEIQAINKKAEEIIGFNKRDIVGKNFKDLIPQLPFDEVISTSEAIKAMLIKINDRDISTTIVPVIVSNATTGALAIINEFTEQEKNQHKLRMQLIGKGHKAKYTFEDIYGKCTKMIELKNMARRIAKSDSSVLISGESGTGKELFAQAIHNSSKRKDYQFVAVNCAALPESLLESELFGYEEGAFTGARRGGKIGLFELAHKGTLFLDEIGEMALNLQSRLLRVIQEREVMRIGGDRVIKIDIRIIAASNKDIKSLIKEGKFRKDLYYRLNVLPLDIIPLRERREDIIELTERIKQVLAVDFKLTNDAGLEFENYSWEGNVRELRNCIEYLAHLDKKIIDRHDISFLRQGAGETAEIIDEEKAVMNKLLKDVNFNKEKFIFVMECLEDSRRNRTRIGRRKIAELAEKEDLFISENEIRGILSILKEYDLVSLSNGRGGTQITALGVRVLKKIKPG